MLDMKISKCYDAQTEMSWKLSIESWTSNQSLKVLTERWRKSWVSSIINTIDFSGQSKARPSSRSKPTDMKGLSGAQSRR